MGRKLAILILSLLATNVEAAVANFISISDIHFDPFASCTHSPCALAQHLDAAPVQEWPQILNQEGPSQLSYYQHDSNYPLLQSALNALQRQVQQQQPQFILMLGDLLAHDFQYDYQIYVGKPAPEAYQAFVAKTIQFLSMQLAQAAPGVPIYPVVGNNDSDIGDYGVVPNGQFLQMMAANWQDLIDQSNRAAFTKGFAQAGYYVLTPAHLPHARLIVLNSILFSPKAKTVSGKNLAQAAADELDWLSQQLQAAKLAQANVWIVAHIPLGIDAYTSSRLSWVGLVTVPYWQTQFMQRYLQLLSQYQAQIKGQFVGHEHMDAFGQISLQGKTLGYYTVTPAISPIFGNNPAFKRYQFDTTTFDPLNYQVYYLKLNAPQRTAEWQQEYDFADSYFHGNLQNLHNGILQLLAQEQIKAGAYTTIYQQYYTVAHENAQSVVKYWLPYYWCALSVSTEMDYQHCYDSNE